MKVHPFRLSIRVRSWLVCAFGAAGLLYFWLRASDLLSVGRRPDSDAPRDFLVSALVGLGLGLFSVIYVNVLCRDHGPFFVEFYSRPLRQRMRWPFQRWNLLYSLPLLVAVEAWFVVVIWRQVAPEPGIFAAILLTPFVAKPWSNIARQAKEKRDRSDAAEIGTLSLAEGWKAPATDRYVQQVILLLCLALAVGMAGYALNLPHIEDRELGAPFLRESSATKPATTRGSTT